DIDLAGDLTIISGNDTNIKGSNIIATGNANITTGGELNIMSAEDSYYKYVTTKKKKSFGRSKRYTSLTETKTGVASNIIISGDLNLDSVTDVNILGSALSGENGTITSQAGNVNIQNSINSAKSYTTSKKRGSTSKSSSKVYDYQEVALESNLAFNNDLEINSELGDVNIQGSTLDVNNDLSFGSFTIAENSDGSLKTKADGTFETVSGDVVQNVNITAAELKREHWEEHKSTSFNPITAAFAAAGEIATLGGLNKVADKLNEKLQERVSDLAGTDNVVMVEKTENKTSQSATIAHSSNITVLGDLNINASEGFKIAASNLNVSGDGNINAAKVDIISVAENSSSYTKNKSIEIGETDVGFRDNSFKASVQGTGVENLYQEENSVQKASNVNIGNNILLNSTNDIDIVASNVLVGNDATIKTGGSVNLSDAKNTQKTNTENSNLEVEAGVKVGNAYVDTAVAAEALADATKSLKDSKDKLDRIQKLKDEGRASQKAVDLAYTQVALASAGVATATVNLAMSVQNAAAAASTSLGTGMYGAVYMDTTYHTDFLKTTSEQSSGSTLIVGNDIDINANEDYNQTGSILTSSNGDINIAAVTANITSGENSSQSDFGSKTITSGVSFGNNGLGISAGYNQSDNFILQNTHTNSEILAENGTFNLNTTGDTNIKGGNVTANQVALNIGGDLNLETLQDTYEQQGSSFGLNIGVGGENPAINNAAISLGSTEIYKQTTGKSTGIISLASNDSNLSEAENLTNLLASNSVNVTGNTSNLTVKEDIDFTNSDFEGTLSVPVDLLTESGSARMKDAFTNFDNNVLTVGSHLKGTVSNVYEAVTNNTGNKSTIDTFVDKQKTQTRNIARSRDNAARDIIKNANRGQSPENLEYALNTGSEVGEGVKVYSNENDRSAGMYDQEMQQAYVNVANVGTNETHLIFTDGHERGHAEGGNELYANMIGKDSVNDWNTFSKINSDYQQTGYNASDYGIRTADNSSYKPTQIQYNQAYNARNNFLLNQNTNNANLVKIENRDNMLVEYLFDLTMVSYDVAKIGYGKIIKDQQLVKEGLIDLAADSTALAIPFAPAGTTKVARLFGKGDDVTNTTKKGSKLSGDHPDNLL
ncbi:hemagglutinin repeat-containing protein, partial [Rickettsiales bacterium]|nr:hemagglutinin repeat-containing protein [Rickettsiales bacterium]